MCEPAQFGPLPDVLSREIAQNWLDARSVAMLDRSHCSHETRSQFLVLMSGLCLRNVAGKGKFWNAVNFLKWLQKLNMAAEHLLVPSTLDASLLGWIKEIGSRVTSASFERGRKTATAVAGLREIVSYFPNLVHIDCSNMDGPAHVRQLLNEALASAIQTHQFHTVIARAAWLTDETVCTIAQHCGNLLHLDVSGSELVSTVSICAIATSCPSLRYIDIHGTSAHSEAVISLLLHCSALTHLDATSVEIQSETLEQTVGNCPELTFLGCSHMSDADFHAIGQGCPKLESLIAWSATATDDGLTTVLEGCQKLANLNVSYSEDLSGVAFRDPPTTSRHAWSLQLLCAELCESLDDDGVHAVLANCPLLRYLDISICGQLTDAAAHAIAVRGDNLTYLSIQGCLEISVEGIRKIGKSCHKLQRVLVSLTKAEHRSVAGLYTRRSIGLEWSEIDMRPWERRALEAQRKKDRRWQVLALIAVGRMAGLI